MTTKQMMDNVGLILDCFQKSGRVNRRLVLTSIKRTLASERHAALLGCLYNPELEDALKEVAAVDEDRVAAPEFGRMRLEMSRATSLLQGKDRWVSLARDEMGSMMPTMAIRPALTMYCAIVFMAMSHLAADASGRPDSQAYLRAMIEELWK